MAEFGFPLAPVPEQRRIVARIDALFAEIAEGEAALAAARQSLETYRRALLKAAVTGDLTADWREANKPAETGHDLLARVRVIKANTAPTKTQLRAAATLVDDTNLPALPGGWAWTTVGDVATGIEYGTSTKCDYDFQGVPVLRMGNVGFGKLDFSDLKFAPANEPVPILLDGDLVFNRTNSAELVGKCSVFNNHRRASHSLRTLYEFDSRAFYLNLQRHGLIPLLGDSG